MYGVCCLPQIASLPACVSPHLHVTRMCINLHAEITFSVIYDTQNTATEPYRLQVTMPQPLVAPQALVSKDPLQFQWGGGRFYPDCEDDGAILLDNLHSLLKPSGVSSHSQSTSHDRKMTTDDFLYIVRVNEAQEVDLTAICAGDVKMLSVEYISGLLPGVCVIMASVMLARPV